MMVFLEKHVSAKYAKGHEENQNPLIRIVCVELESHNT